MLLTHFIVSYLFGSDVMESCGCQGVTIPRFYRPYYLSFSFGVLTNTSSHIHVPAGICQCFCSGMGHSPLSILPPWCFWQCFGPPCPLYTKIVQRHLITSDVVMVMDRWWSLHVLFEPLCKSPARLPCVFFFTVYPSTSEPVDHCTLLQDGISVFGVYQEVFDCISSF